MGNPAFRASATQRLHMSEWGVKAETQKDAEEDKPTAKTWL
jgi:hypothetical protein